MYELCLRFLIALIWSIVQLHLASKILETPLCYRSVRFAFALLFLIFLQCVTSYLLYFRVIVNFIGLVIAFSYLFRMQLKKILIATIILFCLVLFADVTVTMLASYPLYLMSFSLWWYFILNMIVILFSYLLISFLFVTKIRKFLFEQLSKHSIFFLLICLLILSFLLQTWYYSRGYLQGNLYLLLFIVFLFGSLVLFMLLLLEKINYQKVSNENQLLLQHAEEYEVLLDQQRILNHENYNHLLVLRSISKDKKVEAYIDQLLEKGVLAEEELLQEINKIPMNGVRGLVYYKFSLARKYGIMISLDIHPKIHKNLLKALSQQDINDIASILAIYLDNAIDALKIEEEKKMSVSIYIDEERKLVISIANIFHTMSDVQNAQEHRSKKGKGHGYGLLIADEIIRKNIKLKHQTEWVSNIFIQNLYITLK